MHFSSCSNSINGRVVRNSGDKQRCQGTRCWECVAVGEKSDRAVNARAYIDSHELFKNFMSFRPLRGILLQASLDRRQISLQATKKHHHLVQAAHHDGNIIGSEASGQGIGQVWSPLVAQTCKNLRVIKAIVRNFAGHELPHNNAHRIHVAGWAVIVTI